MKLRYSKKGTERKEEARTEIGVSYNLNLDLQIKFTKSIKTLRKENDIFLMVSDGV